MLTKREAEDIKKILISSSVVKDHLLEAIDRATDTWTTNDVVAKGPNMSSTNMLDDAARALGWRTDFATGDSPITWKLVIEAIVKLSRSKPPDATVACVGDRYHFKYPEAPQYDRLLDVVRVTGYKKDDLVFFDDGSHSKQEKMKDLQKVK